MVLLFKLFVHVVKSGEAHDGEVCCLVHHLLLELEKQLAFDLKSALPFPRHSLKGDIYVSYFAMVVSGGELFGGVMNLMIAGLRQTWKSAGAQCGCILAF